MKSLNLLAAASVLAVLASPTTASRSAAARRPAQQAQNADHRAGVRQPVAQRAGPALRQAVARRPLPRGAAQSAERPPALRSVGVRPADRPVAMLVDSEKLGSGQAMSEAEKMQRERKGTVSLKGIVTYDWSADGKSILVPLDGELYLAGVDGTVTRGEGHRQGRDAQSGAQRDRQVSVVRPRQPPVGRPGRQRDQADHPAEGELVHWGEAEFIAQEELDRRPATGGRRTTAASRSSGSTKTRSTCVTRAAIGAAGTKTFEQRYPAAGTQQRRRLAVRHRPERRRTRSRSISGPTATSISSRVDWAPDGKTLYVQRENRAQTAARRARGRSGDRQKPDAVQREGRAAALDQPHRQLQIPRGRKPDLVVGARRLRPSLPLRRRQVDAADQGPWVVTELAGVDQQSHRLFFSANKDDVLAPQVYSLDYLNPGEPQRLTDPPSPMARRWTRRARRCWSAVRRRASRRRSISPTKAASG